MKTKSVGLLQSTAVVAMMTLLSRVLGFIRDLVLASSFGAGSAFDAFIIAFKLPNFLRRLFAEGAFSQAFVPVLSEYQQRSHYTEVRHFLDHVAGMLSVVLVTVVVLAEVFVPIIILLFAPGFAEDPLRYHYTATMLHITLPYLLCIALAAFAGAILNTYSRFGIASLSPIVLNLILIAVAVWWAPHTATPIYTLAWGVLMGGVVQLAVQFPALKKIGLLPMPRFTWKDAGVRRVLKLMVPALFGVSVVQISLLIDSFFASFLQAGSISWLYYSDRFIYFPQGVIGVALSTVVLPHLSRHYANKNTAAYTQTLDWALRTALLIGLPAAIGLFILARPLLAILIGHGAFSDFDVRMTAKSLAALSVGLPAFMIAKILASAFYSQQDIKTPVKIAAISVLMNIIFSILLMHPLAHAGLALATALASTLNALFLLFFLIRKKIFHASMGWRLLLLRLGIANSVMGFVIHYCIVDIDVWWKLVSVIMLGAIVYLISLLLCGARVADFYPVEE